MKNLNISIANKVATYCQRGGAIVCDNPGYMITFTFDSEWDGHGTKTARFKWNNGFVDIVFTGNTVEAPVIENAERVEVGVYVDDMCTTTPAVIPCEKSILSGEPRAFIPADEGLEMLERIDILEANDRSQESRLAALESGAGGGGKLYKHNVYINSGGIGFYANEAKIAVSYTSTSPTPITTLAGLINSPAVAEGAYGVKYLNYAYAHFDYVDELNGSREVEYITVTDTQITIYYITAYTVPVTTSFTKHRVDDAYLSILITDTVTEV